VSKGDNAMKHAVAALQGLGYTHFQKAGRRLVYAGPRGMIALPEDIFGCFDIFAVGPPNPSLLVQVTTHHAKGGSAWNRRTKIMDRFLSGCSAMPQERIWLLSWVRYESFRRWEVEFDEEKGEFAWRETERLPSPLLKTPRGSVTL
jgi:hypothetical protein